MAEYCKSLGYNLLITKAITPYNPDTSVYHFQGHSSDMYDCSADTVQLEPLEDNCVYVTSAICGDNAGTVSGNTADIRCAFSGPDPDERLKNPLDQIVSLKKQYNKSGWDFADLHIKSKTARSNYMKSYVNTEYSCFITNQHPTGLFKIGSELAVKDSEGNCFYKLLESDSFVDYLNTAYKTDTWTDKRKNIVAFYARLFKGSLFPTEDDVINILTKIRFPDLIPTKFTTEEPEDFSNLLLRIFDMQFNKISKKYFTIDQKTLFKYFPGVFYNLSCRGLDADPTGVYQLKEYPEDKTYPGARLRREQSRAGTNEEVQTRSVSPASSQPNPASLAPSSGNSSPLARSGGYRRKTRKSKCKYRKRTARK